MEPLVIADVPMQIDVAVLRKRLHIPEDSAQDKELAELVREALELGHPQALTGIAFIDEHGEDYVVIDGVRFTSRVLAVNLKQVHRVFPYIATCGTELQAWADALDDVLLSFWSEAIREQALGLAMRALDAMLDARYQPGRTARMNPGSLGDWPLREQRPLFRLMGDPQSTIGVELTPSLLMVPTKSVSGLRFATEQNYENCMLCPRAGCPGRRAAYDPGLYDTRYGQA